MVEVWMYQATYEYREWPIRSTRPCVKEDSR